MSQGIANGDNPRLLARKIVATIDGKGAGELGLTDTLGRFIPAQRRAEIMARTEIIRAHHAATIQEYENWGVEGVHVQAEFVTAGDDRVCQQCKDKVGAGDLPGRETNISPTPSTSSLIDVRRMIYRSVLQLMLMRFLRSVPCTRIEL